MPEAKYGWFAFTVRACALHAWVLDGLERTAGASTAFLEGMLQTGLTHAERGALGIALYDRRARGLQQTRLMPWEATWLDSCLPPPPAHVLVGGAGTGREVAALSARGHRVEAFEPSERSVARARDLHGPTLAIRRASYEDLSRAVLDSVRNDAAPLARERYDAVLLGWGSLSHVLDPYERERLMVALRALCPAGPILASFWLDDPTMLQMPSRARKAGRKVGRLAARFRTVAVPPSHDTYTVRGGFCHAFELDEMARLARLCASAVEIEAAPYPHAVFRPAQGAPLPLPDRGEPPRSEGER